MTDLGPEARRVLGLARRGDDPLEADRVRMNHRVAQRLAVAAGVTGAALGTAKAASGAAAFSVLLGKGIVTGALVTAAAFGTWKAADHIVSQRKASSVTLAAQPSAKPVASVSRVLTDARSASTEAEPVSPVEVASLFDAPPPVEVAPGAASSRQRDPAATVRSRKAETHASEPAQPAETDADPLFAETAGMREVQRAMSTGQAERALKLVTEQDAWYADGALVQERAAARIFALCNLGRQEEARHQAQTFQYRFPRSPLMARVRRACENL